MGAGNRRAPEQSSETWGVKTEAWASRIAATVRWMNAMNGITDNGNCLKNATITTNFEIKPDSGFADDDKFTRESSRRRGIK